MENGGRGGQSIDRGMKDGPPLGPPRPPKYPPGPRCKPQCKGRVVPPPPKLLSPKLWSASSASSASANTSVPQRPRPPRRLHYDRACKFHGRGYCKSGIDCRYGHSAEVMAAFGYGPSPPTQWTQWTCGYGPPPPPPPQTQTPPSSDVWVRTSDSDSASDSDSSPTSTGVLPPPPAPVQRLTAKPKERPKMRPMLPSELAPSISTLAPHKLQYEMLKNIFWLHGEDIKAYRWIRDPHGNDHIFVPVWLAIRCGGITFTA
jgi:hypothetical protein